MKSSHGATGCRTPHAHESQRAVRVKCWRGELFFRYCLNNLLSITRSARPLAEPAGNFGPLTWVLENESINKQLK